MSNTCFYRSIDGLLYVSGIDILDGTPIIDIKPYIKQYDCPNELTDCEDISDKQIAEMQIPAECEDKTIGQSLPDNWIDGSVVSDVSVDFTDKSLQQLKSFHARDESNECQYCLKHLKGFDDSKNAISALLRADPRSVYRRTKCVDRLYYFTIDSLHITCWFDIDTNVVEVLKIKPFQG